MVEITAEQFARIEHCMPSQRGNVIMINLNVVKASTAGHVGAGNHGSLRDGRDRRLAADLGIHQDVGRLDVATG